MGKRYLPITGSVYVSKFYSKTEQLVPWLVSFWTKIWLDDAHSYHD